MIDRSTNINAALRSRQRGFLLNPFRFIEKDPYYSNVSLLLHCDGPNGSTTFTDSSSSTKTATRYGGAIISTAQSKFGGASLFCDGAGDQITFANTSSLQFGSGDFTLEFWIRTNKASQPNGFPRVFAKGLYQAAGAWNLTYIKSSGELVFDFYTSGATALGISCGTITDDTWSHVAICRSGTEVKTFLDGVTQASGTNSTNLNATDVLSVCGTSNISGSGTTYAYIDDVRITKGVARYSANFTPPSDPFPNS